MWGSDTVLTFTVNGHTYQGTGIWKALITDINDISKHVCLSTPTIPTSCMAFVKSNTGVLLAGMTTEIHLSKDFGNTWEIFDSITESNLIPMLYDNDKDCWHGWVDLKIQYLK